MGDAGCWCSDVVPLAMTLELALPGIQQQAGCCIEHCGNSGTRRDRDGWQRQGDHLCYDLGEAEGLKDK